MTPFLEVKDVRKQYGAIKAVDGVSSASARRDRRRDRAQRLRQDDALFNSILGQIRPTSGHVEFCGEDITGMSPLELSRARRRPHVPDAAGVRQDVGARQPDRRRAGVQGHARARLFAKAPMPAWAARRPDDRAVPPAARRRTWTRARLSYGQQKLIDIAMAFMPAPRLVLLDEPCAGGNPSLVDQLRGSWSSSTRVQGGSFVVIEHNMDFIMKLCPHVICMVEGQGARRGPPAAVQANRQVLEAYLGN